MKFKYGSIANSLRSEKRFGLPLESSYTLFLLRKQDLARRVAFHDERVSKELFKLKGLLRRVYNAIEMQHLNDHKLVNNYVDGVAFPRQLGTDIFNYLFSHDKDFHKITVRRQKRFRKRLKRRMKV